MLNQTLFSLMNGLAGTYNFIDIIFAFFAVYAIYIMYIIPLLFLKIKPITESIFAAVAGYSLKLSINYIYPVIRPSGTLLITMPSSPSFPSGHATVSFAIATVVYYHNKKLGIFALILALIISVSRVFVGVHYPVDVLFGTLIGVMCGMAANYLFKNEK